MKKILVIQPKMIGDVLASSVICRAVKSAFPDAQVHYLIHRNTQPVIENNPDIDEIIATEPGGKLSDFIALGKQLKLRQYDAVIDAYGKWESIIPTYLSGARIRIGFRKWYTKFFYTKLVVPAKNVSGSAIYHRLQLAEALTGMSPTPEFPKIYLTLSEIDEARAILQKHGDPQKPKLMISVLGSGNSKSLPANQMAEMLDDIAEASDAQMILNFMPSQQEEAMAIYHLCKPKTQSKILTELYTKGLRGFIAVLSQCDALIGNEGGAVNMAKAVGIPTFTIFSPWINKSSWNMLEDDDLHVAVHLNDYHPEIYQGVHPKKFKVQVDLLYKMLKPELFRDKLTAFVKRVTQTSRGTN